MLLPLGTCHSRAGADARYSHYIILGDVVQRVLCFPPSPITVTYKCISPIDYTDTSTRRCHNCSRGTRDASNSGHIARELGLSQPRSSWYSLTPIGYIPLFAKLTFISRRLLSTVILRYVLTARLPWLDHLTPCAIWWLLVFQKLDVADKRCTTLSSNVLTWHHTMDSLCAYLLASYLYRMCVCVCVCVWGLERRVGGWVYKRARTHPRFDNKISL